MCGVYFYVGTGLLEFEYPYIYPVPNMCFVVNDFNVIAGQLMGLHFPTFRSRYVPFDWVF